MFHTLFVLLVEAVLKRISVPDIAAAFFEEQSDSVLLVGQDKLIWFSFQAPLQVRDISVACAPSASHSVTVVSLQRVDRLLSTETCPRVGLQTSVSSSPESEQALVDSSNV